MVENKKCKNCKKDIPQYRLEKRKREKFCSKDCEINYDYKLRFLRK